jgi:uncharacterized protein involved in type VI secretion and phage assembly
MDFLETLMRPQVQQGRNRPQFGLVTAKVTGRMDDGTYELSYLSMGDNEPSAPARMMMPTAGNRRGMYFFPEVGDEVIVAFESGDTNMPVILGAVYNEESPEPDQAQPSNENNVRTIVSRSGHEITLDDSPGGEKVKIRTRGGHELLLDDTPPGKITLQSARGSKLEMDDATLSMKLSAPVKIELQATQIAINATQLQLQSPAGIQLQTTGSPIASLVVIDGKPFGAHVHMPPIIPPAGTTGPVGP